MTLLETLALLTFILTLLGLIVDVIRLAVEVMTMFSKHKRLTAQLPTRAVNLFLTKRARS